MANSVRKHFSKLSKVLQKWSRRLQVYIFQMLMISEMRTGNEGSVFAHSFGDKTLRNTIDHI